MLAEMTSEIQLVQKRLVALQNISFSEKSQLF